MNLNDKITRIEDAIKYGNTILLKASEQAGYLAAALVAAFSVWKSGDSLILIDKLAFLALTLSIFFSIFTHFIVGKTYIQQMKKIIDGEHIENAFYMVWGWVFGIAQIISLLTGLGLIFFLIFNQ